MCESAKTVSVVKHLSRVESREGFFSDFWFSRPGIASQVLDAQSEGVRVILQPSFNEASDWIIGIEQRIFTCDPGYSIHLIAGKLPSRYPTLTALYVELLNLRDLCAKGAPVHLEVPSTELQTA